MRIVGYSAENQNLQSHRVWLVCAVFALGCVTWPPATAFSKAGNTDRLTEIRFASRLHRELDSQLGWEFPLWMDDDSMLPGNTLDVGNKKCETELSQLQPVTQVEVISVDSEKLSRLEWEIIRSLGEVHRLTEQQAVSAYLGELLASQADDQSVAANLWWDYSQVLAQVQAGRGLWLKFVDQVEQQVQNFQLQMVPPHWTKADFWLGFEAVGLARQPVSIDRKSIRLTGIAAKFAGSGPDKQFRSVPQQAGELAPMPGFNGPANGKSDEGPTSVLPVIPLERPLYQEVFSWLDSERIQIVWNTWHREYSREYSIWASDWLLEQWAGADVAQLSERLWPVGEPASEPTIQPIATVSYIGLKPAILSMQRYFLDGGARIGELGQRMARSIPQLPPVQNGALERLVLEQIDAMRR